MTMPKLSSILTFQEIFVNDKGYAWIRLPDYDNKTKRPKVIIRKIHSKPFSNWSVDTVRIDNVHYLIDSQITISPTASASAPYFAN